MSLGRLWSYSLQIPQGFGIDGAINLNLRFIYANYVLVGLKCMVN